MSEHPFSPAPGPLDPVEPPQYGGPYVPPDDDAPPAGPRWRGYRVLAVVVLTPLWAVPWAGSSWLRWTAVAISATPLLSAAVFGIPVTARVIWRAVRWALPRRVPVVDQADQQNGGDGDGPGELPGALNPFIDDPNWGDGGGERSALADPTGAVKEGRGDALVERVEARWGEAAQWARLHHPQDQDVLPPMVGPAVRNGVGGVRLLVDPDPARRSVEDFTAQTAKFRRSFGADSVFAVEGERGLVELHIYERTPLGGPVDISWLRDHPVVGEQVPIGPTVVAGEATLPLRYSAMHTAITDAGKTGTQLAFEVSLAMSDIPSAVIVLDNKGGFGGAELSALADVALLYRSRTEDAWDCIRCALDIMDARLADAPGLANARISVRRPLVTVLVAEGQDVLDSRPPRLSVDVPSKASADVRADAHRRAWMAYTGGRLDAPPSVREWQGFLVEQIAKINRLGRRVAVRTSWGSQLAQTSFAMPTELKSTFPVRWAGRLPAESDIKPALGVEPRYARCDLIPDWQKGAGYVRLGGSAPPLFHRPVLVDDYAVDEVLVPHYRRYWFEIPVPRVQKQLHVVGGEEQ